MSVSALRRKSPFFNKKEMKFFPSMRTRSIQKTTTIFRNDLSKWSFETIFRNNLSKLVYEGIETFWQRRWPRQRWRRRLSWGRRRRAPSYEQSNGRAHGGYPTQRVRASLPNASTFHFPTPSIHSYPPSIHSSRMPFSFNYSGSEAQPMDRQRKRWTDGWIYKQALSWAEPRKEKENYRQTGWIGTLEVNWDTCLKWS